MKKLLLLFALVTCFVRAQSVTVTYSLAVGPPSVALSASGTQQFTATASSTGGPVPTFTPTLTWSASTGSISQSGFYTAPATINTLQTATVKATDGILSASATITLDPTLYTLTVTNGSGSGSYTAGTIVSVAANTPNSGQMFSAWLGPVASASSPSTTVTMPAAALSITATYVATPTSPITLPVEVGGVDGSTTQIAFVVPPTANLTGQITLTQQIHNLKYQTEASIQVNKGTWTPLNSSTLTLDPMSAAFGGIGGGFSTLQTTMPLPGTLVAGQSNTITYRFNGTDGVISEFRVISLQITDGSGNPIIPASAFVYDSPANWVAPLNDPTDIAAGKLLFQTQTLFSSHMASLLKAHCNDCHTADGRDLKYFNYDNKSIIDRAQFHGLTTQQGQQIASYIRSLNSPAPANARPWNPPYQPGPGLDEGPVSSWAAGAGLSAVLPNDAAMIPYMMPGGSAANMSVTGFLNQRELPIAQQLPDWNRWLPQIHPLDAMGATFTNSAMNQLYLSASAALVPNNAKVYANEAQYLAYFAEDQMDLSNQFHTTCPVTTTLCATEDYSLALWGMVKFWEMSQINGLEGMPSAYFGSKSEARAWITQLPFFTSPNMLKLPSPTPAVGNGSPIAFKYFAQMWYQLQLVLNDGGPQSLGSAPIDYPYSYSFIGALSYYSPATPGMGALMIEWLTKGLQLSQFDGTPASGQQGSLGWNILTNNPENLIVYPLAPAIWSSMPASQRALLINTYLTQWLSKLQSFTPQMFYTGGFATPTDVIAPTYAGANGNNGSRMAFMIPQLLYWGANPSLVSQITAFFKTVWPGFDWAADQAAVCTPGNGGQVSCVIQ
jgi:mono/diheme cytochrome c family protein